MSPNRSAWIGATAVSHNLVGTMSLDTNCDLYVQDALDLPEFEAFEEECLDADGLALVEYAIDMQNRGCILDLTGHGRRLQTFISLSLGSNEPPETCPWDDINDIVNDVDTVCCGGGVCDGSHPPTECSPGCAVAMHEFHVSQCGSCKAFHLCRRTIL